MNPSLATRIFIGHAVVLLTFGAVSILSVVQMHRIGEEIRLVSEGYLPLTKAMAQIETFHKNRQRETDQLLEEKDPETLRTRIKLARLYYPQVIRDRVQAARKTTHASLERAPDAERNFLRELDQKLADLESGTVEHERTSAALFAAIESPAAGTSYAADRLREVRALERRLDVDIKGLAAALDQRVGQRVRTAERSEARGAWLIIGLSLLAIVLGLVATLLAGRTLAPIRRLTEGVTRIGRGDYSAQVPPETHDEIGVLAREFNQMAASLRARERELSEKQQALLRAERLAAIGRVGAQIAHEIRNPLSSIGLNAEMLDEALAASSLTPGQEKEIRELLAAIAREVDRLTEVTEHYLRFARLPKSALEAWDLNEIASSVLDFVAEENARAKVQVLRRLAPGLPPALADEGQVRQALINLLRNAREAMAAGGTITVETRAAADSSGFVELIVADTGPGIDAADLSRIFDPFFSTKERGTGLGLALTHQIVQEHGGTIRCECEPGKGAAFTMRLRTAPAARAGATPRAEGAPDAANRA